MRWGVATNKRVQSIIRIGGLVASVAIALYTLLITTNILPRFGYNFSDTLGYLLAVTWLSAGLLQYIFFGLSPRNTMVRIVSYHVLAAIYIVGITGFASLPFLACWVILTYATYSYYALRGMVISATILWLTGVVDGLLHRDIAALVDNIVMATSLSIVIFVIIYITKAQERDEGEFEASKQAESLQRESLQTLINNIADAVLSTDQNGTIRLYNAATIGLLDTNTDLVGKSIDKVLHLRDEDDQPVLIKTFLKDAHGVTINDMLRATISDEEIRIEATYSPIRGAYTQEHGQIADNGYIIILRDITKTKSLEEERDEFISVVSHELRTPITIAEGAIDNARLVFKKDPSQIKLVDKSMSMAHDQVIFLSKMVNDLSTLSRAERGIADTPELIDVRELVHSLYEDYTAQAKAKGLRFNLSAHGQLGNVNASRLYLHELLQNFITNAIKYTKEGSITLTVERSETMVHFSVSDTGIGMSKADQSKVFQKFYRSEDYRTRETGGTGLGLYVAEKLARKMATSIALKSRLNHGSTFSFSLPVATKKK